MQNIVLILYKIWKMHFNILKWLGANNISVIRYLFRLIYFAKAPKFDLGIILKNLFV